MTYYICDICGDRVRDCDLREHLVEHNPNARGIPWAAVQAAFTIEEDADADN